VCCGFNEAIDPLKLIIRRMYGPTVDPNCLRRKTNEINILLKQRNIVRYIKAQRLASLGHLERMHEERTTKKITRWKSLSSRPKGRPKKNWETDVLQDLQIMKIKRWKTCVRRKEQWKKIGELAKTHSGLYSCSRKRRSNEINPLFSMKEKIVAIFVIKFNFCLHLPFASTVLHRAPEGPFSLYKP
jgi:hypothetical protein